MATAQVIFQRFYYSKSYVKYSIYVSDFSLQYSQQVMGGCIVRSYMVSGEWFSCSILSFPELNPPTLWLCQCTHQYTYGSTNSNSHVVVSSDYLFEMVSINLVDPLSIEHNTNSSLGLEVKYVAKKTQCHYPSLISVVCMGYVLLSNTKFLISGDVQHFFLSISCKYLYNISPSTHIHVSSL